MKVNFSYVVVEEDTALRNLANKDQGTKLVPASRLGAAVWSYFLVYSYAAVLLTAVSEAIAVSSTKTVRVKLVQ